MPQQRLKMLCDATKNWHSQIKFLKKVFFKKEYEWLANDHQIFEVFTTNVRERKKLTTKGIKPKAMYEENFKQKTLKS